MTRSKISHGGFREGSGSKPKDPDAGPRKMVSVRLHPDTVTGLKRLVNQGNYLSQGEAIDALVKAATRS